MDLSETPGPPMKMTVATTRTDVYVRCLALEGLAFASAGLPCATCLPCIYYHDINSPWKCWSDSSRASEVYRI